jgi:hypothetical protein
MIAGIVASVQGAVRGAGLRFLTSEEFIELFRSSETGWPQTNGPYSGNIGNRPDFSLLIPAALNLAGGSKKHPRK